MMPHDLRTVIEHNAVWFVQDEKVRWAPSQQVLTTPHGVVAALVREGFIVPKVFVHTVQERVARTNAKNMTQFSHTLVTAVKIYSLGLRMVTVTAHETPHIEDSEFQRRISEVVGETVNGNKIHARRILGRWSFFTQNGRWYKFKMWWRTST